MATALANTQWQHPMLHVRTLNVAIANPISHSVKSLKDISHDGLHPFDPFNLPIALLQPG